MLKGNWNNKSAIGGLIALIGLALWFLISDLSSVSQGYEGEASYRSKVYADNAEREIASSCAPLAPLNKVECTEKSEQAKRDNQRDEQDLAAQKISAWWTRVMGIAALIGMAISVIGVWLVWTTFDETREANRISIDTAVKTLRPYLVFGPMRIQPSAEMAEGIWDIWFDLINQGQTPARLIFAEAGRDIVHDENGDFQDMELRAEPAEDMIVPKGAPYSFRVAVREETMFPATGSPDRFRACYVIALAKIAYRGVTDADDRRFESERGRKIAFMWNADDGYTGPRVQAMETTNPRHDHIS